MRPCIESILNYGLQNKTSKELYEQVRKDMTFAIIHDLKRMGFNQDNIKKSLLEWNDRCIIKLTLNEAKRKLCDFVDWFFKRECKLSCKKLADYCLFSSGFGCFFQKKTPLNTLNYNLGEMRCYLENKYPQYALGYRLFNVLSVLYDVRQQKGVENIFIGLRAISDMIYNNQNGTISGKELSRLLYKLQDEDIIKIKKGEAGSFGYKRANEYCFNSIFSIPVSLSHNIALVGGMLLTYYVWVVYLTYYVGGMFSI